MSNKHITAAKIELADAEFEHGEATASFEAAKTRRENYRAQRDHGNPRTTEREDARLESFRQALRSAEEKRHQAEKALERVTRIAATQ